MPDVGVLQLKISADASSASKSLKTLQARLSEINDLAKENFNLGNVSTQIQNIVNAVKGDKGVSTAVKNLGTLLNAIAAFSKVKGVGLGEEEIKKLSTLQTVANGFKLGNAGTQLNKLREALGGSWNTDQAESARQALETLSAGARTLSESGTAAKIKDVSKSLENITAGKDNNLKETTKDIVDYQKAVDEIGETLKDAQVTFKEPMMKVNLQQFGGKQTFENESVQNWRDTMNGIREVNEGLKQTNVSSINNIGELQETLSRLARIPGAGNLQKFSDGIRAVLEAAKAVGQSHLTLNRLAGALERLGNVGTGFKLPSFGKLESLARTLQENFNAENGLNRLADGITAFKDSMQGFDSASASNVIRIVKSINGGTGTPGGAVTAMKAYGESVHEASNVAAISGFAESATRISEVAVASNETAEAVNGLIEKLETQIDYSNIQKYVDHTTGVAREAKEVINETNSAFNVPAVDQDGPFKYASDEILRYTELLNKSKEDLAFWENEYANIQNRIKYNGETEERTQALGQAEKSFYLSLSKVEEYEAALARIKEHVSKFNYEVEKGVENAVAPVTSKAAESIKQVTKSVDIGIERVEALRRVFSNSSDTVKKTIAEIFHVDKDWLFPKTASEQMANLNSQMNAASASAQHLQNSLRREYGAEMVDNLVNASSKADLLKMRIDALKQSLATKINNNTVDGDQIAQATSRIQALQAEYDQLTGKTQEVAEETKSFTERVKELMFGTDGLQGAFKRMFPTISGLLGRFRQLVKYRILRAIIKQISEGFREGMENYYYYSKAIGGEFAPAMDSAASALLQMKNSIGAAAAPLIQSLIPWLQTAVNAFINIINYANQFIALMRGQTTWSQAVPATASAFGDVENAANGAGAAIKDLLADWDELNIIQSENSKGGGGGGTAAMEDYLNMFEETSEFDNKVKGIVNFIKDNFGDILSIAKAVGAAILAWKISKAFNGLFEKFGLLAGMAATIYIGVKLTDMFGKEYVKTGEPGWFIADALTGAVGAGIAGKIASKLFGGATAGFVVAGFTLALEGAVNIKNAVTAMDQRKEGEAWALDALGSLEAGIGVALATFKFIGPWSLALGATIAVGTFLLSIPIMMEIKRQAEYRDMAIAAFSETGENGIDPETYIKALQTRLDELTVGARLTIDAFAGFDEHGDNFSKNMEALKNLNTLLTSGDKLTTEQATQFKDAWHIVFESMEELSKISFDTIYAGLSSVVANGSEELKKQAGELRKQTLEIQGIVGGTQARIKKEMEMLVNTITSPTTDKEELEKAIERYDYLYKVMADAEDSGIKDIKKRFAGGEGFDFSKEEKPVQAAVDFIQRIASEDLTPALENVKAAYEDGVASIEEVKKNLDIALAIGDIDKPTYDKFMDVLLGDEAILKQQMEERVKEINDLRNDAYRQLISQALAGYNDVKSDSALADAYVKNVMNPILDALDAAGFNTEVYRKIFEPPEDGTAFYEVEFPEGERDQIYQQIMDEFGSTDTIGTIHKILAYEVDLQMETTGNGSIDSGSDLAADIINSVLNLDGMDYGNAISGIADLMKWDIEDILSQIDLTKFDTEELEILLETIQQMKEELEFTNPISDTDESDVAEKTRNIAQAYEDMAERINRALKYGNDDSFFGRAQSLVMQGISSAFGTVQNAMNVAMPSDITIREERDSEQEASNTAEGVRRGNTDLVTGQNQANNYMAQMVRYLAIIAQKSGGSVGLAQSALGGMVSAAMEAFGNITG